MPGELERMGLLGIPGIPPLKLKKPEALFRQKVFKALLSKGKITTEMIAIYCNLPSLIISDKRHPKSGADAQDDWKKNSPTLLPKSGKPGRAKGRSG